MEDKEKPPETEQDPIVLIMDYQERKEGAAERLIDYFKPLIGQLTHLIKRKEFNPRSYTQRCFLAMFSKDRKAGWSLRSKKPDGHALEVAQSILSMLEGFYKLEDEEDIRHDVIEILLFTLSKFRYYIGCSLTGYLNTAFVANLARRCKRTVKDPLVNLANDKIVPFCEFAADGEQGEISGLAEVNKLMKDYSVFLHDDEETGTNWILGLTCGDEFRKLTPLERLLLKLRFADGYGRSEVAMMFGMTNGTLSRKVKIAIWKLLDKPIPQVICVDCGKDYSEEVACRRGTKSKFCNSCRQRRIALKKLPKRTRRVG